MTELLERMARLGGTVSGGPVGDDFTRGWAKHPFRGERAHHWSRLETTKETAYLLYSACGMTTIATARVPLLGAGTYAFCKRCENLMMKPYRHA